MKCPLCGAENAPDATKCYLCNHKLQKTAPVPGEQFRRKTEFYPSAQTMIPRTKTQTPIYAAGLLLLVALADFLGILISNVYVGYYVPELKGAMVFASVFVGILAIVTVAGGFLAVFRRHWGPCLAATIVTLVFHALFGAILRMMMTVAALVFVILARKEFD